MGLGQQQRCRGHGAQDAEGGCCRTEAIMKKHWLEEEQRRAGW